MYQVEDYMEHVEGYFDFLDLIKPIYRGRQKVVYLITDDPLVIKNLVKK